MSDTKKHREFVPNQIAKNESIDYIIDLIRKTYVKSTSVVGWYSHRIEGEVRGPFNRWIVPRKVHKDYEHNVADVADEVEYIAAAMNYAPNLVLEIEKLKAELKQHSELNRKLANHNADKTELITKLTRQRDEYLAALQEANEFTSSVLEDLEHYYDNKCIPTADEVNQASIADSRLRYVIGKALQEAEGME